MRTSSTLWLATAGLVAFAGGVLLAPGTPASADPLLKKDDRTLQLTQETEQFHVVDLGEPGLGLGDEIVSSDRVLRDGVPVGRSGTVLTVVGVKPGVLTTQLLTTLDLPEGQLVLEGIGDGPAGPPTSPITVTVAVTGGTGAYATARGSAQIVDFPGGNEELTVQLQN